MPGEDHERLPDGSRAAPPERPEVDLETGEEHQHQEPERPDLVQQLGALHQSEDRTDEDPEENLDDHRGRAQPGGDRWQQERGDPDDHQRAGAVHHSVPSTAAAASASAPVDRTSSSTGQCSSGRWASSRIPGP